MHVLLAPPVPKVTIVAKKAAKVNAMPAVTAIWPSKLNQPHIQLQHGGTGEVRECMMVARRCSSLPSPSHLARGAHFGPAKRADHQYRAPLVG